MATQISDVFHGQDSTFLENHCMRRNNDRGPKKQLNQKKINELGQKLDNGLLVTHVNQTQDLLVYKDHSYKISHNRGLIYITNKLQWERENGLPQQRSYSSRLQGDETQHPVWENSEDWLSMHSLKSKKLTLADLICQGTAVLGEASSVTKKMHFPTQTVHQFEAKLSDAIELYQQRIQWLTENSKKAFGLIKGARVGILIDVAAVSSDPQKEEFQNDLMSSSMLPTARFLKAPDARLHLRLTDAT